MAALRLCSEYHSNLQNYFSRGAFRCYCDFICQLASTCILLETSQTKSNYENKIIFKSVFLEWLRQSPNQYYSSNKTVLPSSISILFIWSVSIIKSQPSSSNFPTGSNKEMFYIVFQSCSNQYIWQLSYHSKVTEPNLLTTFNIWSDDLKDIRVIPNIGI